MHQLPKARSQAAVIHCIDPRFRTAVENLLAQELSIPIQEMTVTSVAGGTRDVTEGKPGEELIRFCCEVATQHHGAGIICLVNHHDCGAYGGSAKFASFAEEVRYHEAELQKAKAYILRKIPAAKEVRGYFAWMNGEVRLDRKV